MVKCFLQRQSRRSFTKNHNSLGARSPRRYLLRSTGEARDRYHCSKSTLFFGAKQSVRETADSQWTEAIDNSRRMFTNQNGGKLWPRPLARYGVAARKMSVCQRHRYELPSRRWANSVNRTIPRCSFWFHPSPLSHARFHSSAARTTCR